MLGQCCLLSLRDKSTEVKCESSLGSSVSLSPLPLCQCICFHGGTFALFCPTDRTYLSWLISRTAVQLLLLGCSGGVMGLCSSVSSLPGISAFSNPLLMVAISEHCPFGQEKQTAAANPTCVYSVWLMDCFPQTCCATEL